ncbi:MAG: phage tail protein [Saprospiraceae bacterium]|nr:phage tail protein [Saprospiraceae bacterium]
MAWDWEYPVPAFTFKVELPDDDSETSFQEVSGLETRLEVEQYKAGGENNIIYHLPVRTTYQPLVLKRGVSALDSAFIKWAYKCMSDEANLHAGFGENLKDLKVYLLDPTDSTNPLLTWEFLQAFPVKWSLGNFNSQQNALAIETIEIVYQKMTRS